MPDPLYHCPEHGFETQAADCSEDREQLLTDSQRKQLSKFMSGSLRHFPKDAGLTLDENGWTAFDELVSVVTNRYEWADRQIVEGVIAVDPKGRFERRGGQIRAAYGHSVEVTIERDGESSEIPDVLYHGTPKDNLPSIEADGLLPMGRQAVHLTETAEEALDVGHRHSEDSVVLQIDTSQLREEGLAISKDGKSVYTVDRVPPNCLENLDD